MVELLALGPLELWHEGRQHSLGSPKERCVLAVLLYAQGDPVSVDTLVERVWEDDDLPTTAVETLHSYLSRLRGRLRHAVGDLAQVERPSPRRYRLRLQDDDDVDLLRLQRLRGEARTATERGDRELAVELLHTAEALWRGEPFVELTGTWAASARARLSEDHRRVREERIRLELELGRHADLIGELHELVSQHPLAQRAIASLMIALYRSGRDGDALAWYQDTRRRLRDELGTNPGRELQELQRRILAQDTTLGVPEAVERSGHPLRPRNGASPEGTGAAGNEASTLPRDTKDFTGRTSELRVLLAEPFHAGEETALPLTVVHGMPGVGKTSLVVHAAHRLRSRYPDGRYYVDLCGYSDQAPYEPAEALAFLLRSAGVSDQLPATLDGRIALWREWAAHHRALVVLDNARDAEQVHPLLPGMSTCSVIVASRNRLADLAGAVSVSLDVLPASEASALFTRIAGGTRASDTAALRRVVDLCGCHPLTVQLMASRFRHRDTWDLEYVASRLAGATDRLDEFDERVVAAFQLSYTDLNVSAQRLFRLLALHPGPDITLEAASALCGAASAEVRRAADQLLDRHLLDEAVRDRYHLHDLARAFGGRLCHRADSAPVRHEALRRLMAYYLTAADTADRLAHPRRRRREIGTAYTSSYAPDFVDAVPGMEARDAASAWLTVECTNLLAVARMAADEFPDYVGSFSHVLAYSLKLWGTWDTTAELHGAAVFALRSAGDRPALAQTLVEQASVLAKENHGEALRCASEAGSLFEHLGDFHGRADALFEAGRAHLAAGRGDICFRETGRALRLYQQIGNRFGVAECLNVQGTALMFGAEHQEAMRRFEEMLEIHREIQDSHGKAKALNNLGDALVAQGLHDEALHYYEQSLTLVRQFGGRQEFATLDTNLGTVYRLKGELDLAISYFRRALASNRARGSAVGEVNALTSLGATRMESGWTDDALRYFRAAEEVSRRIDNPYERQRALIGIADAQVSVDQSSAALENFRSALEIAQRFNFPLGAAHALAGLAQSHLRVRNVESARSYAESALTLYQKLGSVAEVSVMRRFLYDLRAIGS